MRENEQSARRLGRYATRITPAAPPPFDLSLGASYVAAPMLGSLSQRLLTLLQLTRMALVFTAIADGLCTLLLAARQRAGPGGSLWEEVSAAQVLSAVAVSAGLYGVGVSLRAVERRVG